ncbi:MAG TPA: oligopeptide:H+ symporter, partial [Lacipirellulaceae bacterium]|nr:oligopeptide:H+ symporter [Lacipirellulaceae bacterium]
FSYYGMRALLVLYMIKGFLHYGDDTAYGVYGAYTALVYTNGFIGGLFADRILGQRRSAILGGLLMAAGHLLMTVQDSTSFYFALGLIIAGNGFFKPNVTSMLGTLYPAGSPRRDGGYTIYYMGVNLGGALAPLVCGYVGERYGWHYGFGLATIGMLVGLAVFVAPILLTQILIGLTAILTTIALLLMQDNPYQLAVNIFAGIVLLVAAVVAFIALGKGGLPESAGQAPDPGLLSRRIGPFRLDVLAYIAGILLVPVIAILLPHTDVVSFILMVFGVLSVGYVLVAAFRGTVVERERLYVVLILTLFSMLFWAYFEQAGSSMNNFTDRNIDRVFEGRSIAEQDVGSEIKFRIPVETENVELKGLPPLTQEQLGEENGDAAMGQRIADAIRVLEADKKSEDQLKPEELDAYVKKVSSSNMLTFTGLTLLREAEQLVEDTAKKRRTADSQPRADHHFETLTWKIVSQNIGMGVGGSEVPASMFQSANSIYILMFGLVFTALWTILATRGWEPSTPVKFAMGLAQVGLGFIVLWYGATYLVNARGMVPMWCLLLGILLHTTGELSQSPIGLSMVTKLSPKYLLSTVMGTWFVGLGIANDLAGRIAKLTDIGGGDGNGPQVVPIPSDTVHIYGHVFGQIAVAAFITALVCLALSPLLTRWMHAEAD